jgi:hypothetical protein
MVSLQITLFGATWEVYYRYREFDALRQFVESELKTLDQFQSIPPFPHKTIGRIGEKGLQARKDALEQYVSFLCGVGAYNVSNISDVLSSFLEVRKCAHRAFHCNINPLMLKRSPLTNC